MEGQGKKALRKSKHLEPVSLGQAPAPAPAPAPAQKQRKRKRQRVSAASLILSFLCEMCGFFTHNLSTLDALHVAFKGKVFCAAEEGPAAAKRWLQDQQAAEKARRRAAAALWRAAKKQQKQLRSSSSPPPSTYLCHFCAFYADSLAAVDDQHAAFQGHLFCALEEGPGGRTPQQWLQEQQQAASQQRQSQGVSSSGSQQGPARCTKYRRRVAQQKDQEVLRSQRAEASEPGEPCNICGQERRLDDGHAYFKGQFFCSMEEGPGGRTAQQWLEAQREPEDKGRVPRTTAWNLKKRWQRQEEEKNREPEEEEEEVEEDAAVPGGSGEGQKKKRRKHKPHKPHKLRICKRCAQPMQKAYGHSQYGGRHFCALHAGKSVELWLAEQRSKKRGGK